MAKKVTGYIKLQIPAGKATPAPPVGPALGQHGVNIVQFTKEFNARTADQDGMIIPVVITVYADRSFSFITKTPPAAVLLKKPQEVIEMKRGKKYVEAAKAVDRATLYDTNEAISLVKKAAVAKFDETIEVHIRTGCDGRHADQQIRGAVVLPHGTGKTVRVLVFAKDAKAEEAKAAGADFVGAEDLIPKIQNEGWLDFDVVVATPDMMGVVGRLGRVLGPKGLMPNPKAGTVTMDVTKAINDIKAGKIEYRLDKSNIIHVPIGKASFTEEQLSDNFQTLIGAIVKARPSTLKGQYLKSVVIAPTMGPGVKINPIKLA